ncbi:hypothetical protein ACQJBY_038958 [Aegilops geniculata]
MAGGAADGRQIRVDPAVLEHRRQSPPRQLPRRQGPRETASPPIPNELLLDIFRRIPSPTDLVRTSAACVTFRRLIADRSFLRQYRRLHAPPLLGFIDSRCGFQPADPPYPSAQAARAVALAADFSFSFVPAPADPSHRWAIRDIRDGRVLLGGTPRKDFHEVIFTEMVVCDPLHRRYLLLPPIPDDLAATMENPLEMPQPHFCETFLVPQGDNYGVEASAAGETSFKVIWMVQCRAKLVAFVFSSSTRQWRAVPSQSWANLLAGLLSSTRAALFYGRQYASGCFYWLPNWRYEMKMLVLDPKRMEFSIAEPPPEAKKSTFHSITMVESGEGRPRMLVSGHDTSGRNYTIWRKNCGSSSQWLKDKIFSPSLDSWYLVLDHHRIPSLEPNLCTLDIETLQLERVCASTVNGFAYNNYPPSLSSPTISSGVEEEVLEQRMEALQAEGSLDGHQDESTADEADA